MTAPALQPGPFTTQIPVRFGDVDPAGIAYYPRLINFLHVALEEFFAACVDKPYASAIEEGLLLPTARLEIDFIAPVRFGDVLEIAVIVEHVGRTSVRMRYEGRVRKCREGRWEKQPVFIARSVVVAVMGPTLEPTPIPEWLRYKLESRGNDAPGPTTADDSRTEGRR